MGNDLFVFFLEFIKTYGKDWSAIVQYDRGAVIILGNVLVNIISSSHRGKELSSHLSSCIGVVISSVGVSG